MVIRVMVSSISSDPTSIVSSLSIILQQQCPDETQLQCARPVQLCARGVHLGLKHNCSKRFNRVTPSIAAAFFTLGCYNNTSVLYVVSISESPYCTKPITHSRVKLQEEEKIYSPNNIFGINSTIKKSKDRRKGKEER